MPYPTMGYSFDKAKFELAKNGEQEKQKFMQTLGKSTFGQQNSQQKDFALNPLHNSKYPSVLKKLASATF